MSTDESHQSDKKMIFPTEIDVKKAIAITFVAFLFAGFQAAIYGMTTVPVSEYFGEDSSMIVFYDSFGMWGQILAMAIGGFVISRIKAKNTLLMAGFMMLTASSLIMAFPVLPIYLSMSFICNMAIGFVLVSCYYMTMGTVREKGEGEGKLALLNVFFSAGFMMSPIVNGFVIYYGSWKTVFGLIAVMFVIFVVMLLILNVSEITDKEINARNKDKEKMKSGDDEKKRFLTLPLMITAVAFFLLVYVEQIMNNLNQPRMQQDLGFNIRVVGAMVTTYALSQMFGRIVFGKFLLPRVQIHKYIIISSVIFAVCMVAFMNLTSVYAVAGFMVLLGLADSCLYPALVGYGLDQLEHTSPQATSFMITIGSIGIPVGTAMSGLVGVQFGRMTSMAIGPVLLIVVAVLIYIVKKMSDGKDAKLAPVSSFAGTR